MTPPNEVGSLKLSLHSNHERVAYYDPKNGDTFFYSTFGEYTDESYIRAHWRKVSYTGSRE